MLHLEAADLPLPTSHNNFSFRIGPNLVAQEDKFESQAAWLWNRRYDQLTPRAAVKDPDALARQVQEGKNVTQNMLGHPDMMCSAMLTADPVLGGKRRSCCF